MPTQTFLNLPPGKRARVEEAAMNEFSRVPFDEVSVKRIVEEAGIPRGSFYQYFTDKEDLFGFLLRRVKEHLDERTGTVDHSGVRTIFALIKRHVEREINVLDVIASSGPEAAFLRNIAESQIASAVFDRYLTEFYATDELIGSLIRDANGSAHEHVHSRALLELLVASGKSAVFSVLQGRTGKKEALALLRAKIEILERSYSDAERM